MSPAIDPMDQIVVYLVPGLGVGQRLTKWRKDEAKRRGVDEQVILPGHCLQGLADLEDLTLDAIAHVPGIGVFRADRDGPALIAVLSAPVPASAEPAT